MKRKWYLYYDKSISDRWLCRYNPEIKKIVWRRCVETAKINKKEIEFVLNRLMKMKYKKVYLIKHLRKDSQKSKLVFYENKKKYEIWDK